MINSHPGLAADLPEAETVTDPETRTAPGKPYEI